MLAARDLTKEYQSGTSALAVLRDVSFDIPQGTFISIVGPSGSGKTTLLGLLAGLDLPSRGSVTLDGADLTRLDEDARALDLLKRVGLGDRTDHFPNQLSGGEQQRVAIARAFANRPRILFADEPTGNLDGTTGARIVELLDELNRESGATVVIVTHDLTLAEHAQRVIRLKDGVVVEDRPSRNATAPDLAAAGN
jgi:putative ABC transport system ATP-binding protein